MAIQQLRLKTSDRWLDGLYRNYDQALAAATTAAQTLPVGTLLTVWSVHNDQPDQPATKWPMAGWIVKQRPAGNGNWIETQGAQSIQQRIEQQAHEVSG